MANDDDIPIWQRDEPLSPCTRQCVVHPETKFCLGCKRSLDEIAAWGTMSQKERYDIMAQLQDRTSAPTTRRGNRRRAPRNLARKA